MAAKRFFSKISMKYAVWGMMLCGGVCTALATAAEAKTVDYTLTVAQQSVNITGEDLTKITINGGVPGPVLRFTEGDEAVIRVVNQMDMATSVHWHGLIVPGDQDGVTDFNGYQPIPPKGEFTYRFPLRQAGTYWYHSHTNGQEQDGHYGAILVAPKGKDPIKAARDYVVLVSDFSREDSGSIIAHLKGKADYYATARYTLGDFWQDVSQKGFGKAWGDALDWGSMRMTRTDLADVTGYSFLINGQPPSRRWTGLFSPHEKVRLRFINAGTMSIFDVRIPGLTMSVVQADGQNVEPVAVDEFRFAPGETYDVVVTPADSKAYTLVAEPIDRSGFALGTLATEKDMVGETPVQRPRAILKMGDMGGMDMAGMDMTPADMKSGWAETGMPKGLKALAYADLRAAGIQPDQRAPERTIDVRLGGNMERYIWTMNGKTYDEAAPIHLRYGERVRLTFTNESMMAHPMHLHGMFVQLDNGQPAAKLPNKHTVIVPPGKSYSVLLTADQVGEWAFHCHLLYHMATGMMRKVVVAKLDAKDMPPAEEKMEGGHHAH